MSDVITFMLGQPLDFQPNSRYAYSNLRYRYYHLPLSATNYM